MANYDKKITPSYINKRIEFIRKQGLESVTETSYVKQTFPYIVIGSELKNEGNIRTYEQVIEYRKKYDKKFDKIEYTKDQYNEDLKMLYGLYKDRLTIKGEREYQKNKMLATINTFLPDIDTSKFSLEQLKEAFSQAHEFEREQSRKGKKVDSETFWKEVKKYIEEIGEDEE